MQAVTRELRQFETIFLTGLDGTGVKARIFTEQEELGFAGHPVLGAAAVLHGQSPPTVDAASWRLQVKGRTLAVHTRRRPGSEVVDCDMDQGAAALVATFSA